MTFSQFSRWKPFHVIAFAASLALVSPQSPHAAAPSTLAPLAEIEILLPPDFHAIGVDYADGLFWISDNYLGSGFMTMSIHKFDSLTGAPVLPSLPSAVTSRGGARDIVIIQDSIYQPEDNANRIQIIRKVDGLFLRSVSHAGNFPIGIASDGVFYYVGDQDPIGVIIKRRLSNDTVEQVFALPSEPPATTYFGLTHALGFLWMARDGVAPDFAQKIDPDTGVVVEAHTLPSAIESLEFMDLVFDGDSFWFLVRERTPVERSRLIRAPLGWGGASSQVSVDIKPGSDPNTVNVRSRGAIPVAVLSSMTFDATTVDGSSVRFGPAEATVSHEPKGHFEDVNGDGLPDWVGHFGTQETGVSCSDTVLSVRGMTSTGELFHGFDSIRTAGCP